MKKSLLKRALIALSGIYLVGTYLIISQALADEPGEYHDCYRTYSINGSVGIWYCPDGMGGSCTHVWDTKNYVSKTRCYTADPPPK